MDLDLLLLDLESLNQELLDLLALVALELQDLTVVSVLVDMAVATEILLKGLQNTLQVVLGGDTLDGSDSLAAVALLASDVDIVERSRQRLVTSVSEWIFS